MATSFRAASGTQTFERTPVLKQADTLNVVLALAMLAAVAGIVGAFTRIGIDASDIVGLAGVFHCIVMHVPDATWIFEDDFETGGTSVWSALSPP